MKRISYKKIAFTLLIVIYGLILIYVLLFRNIGVDYPMSYFEYLKKMNNFIPLKSIYVLVTTPMLSPQIVIRFCINFFGNIVLFIPWGILLPFLNKNFQDIKMFIVATVITIVIIETFQIFTMLGVFDVEDILLNTCGSLIGFAIWKNKIKKD